jgi:carboxypeptidase C (cathepsin A)
VGKYFALVLDAGIPVLLYQGLFDWIDGVFSNEQWILDLDWSGKEKYNAGDRNRWELDGELVGFTRNYGPLTQVTVRNAGHSVPLTQPAAAFALARDFVRKTAQAP